MEQLVQILIEYLIAHIPAALVAEVAGIAGAIVGVIALVMKHVPGAKSRRKWLAPLLAFLLGQVAGFLAVGMDTSRLTLGAAMGLLIALTAIGSVSAGKNVTQGITQGIKMSHVRQKKSSAM